jgi:hypothetical protein
LPGPEFKLQSPRKKKRSPLRKKEFHTCNPTLKRLRQKVLKFKASLSWAT